MPRRKKAATKAAQKKSSPLEGEVRAMWREIAGRKRKQPAKVTLSMMGGVLPPEKVMMLIELGARILQAHAPDEHRKLMGN